MSLPDLINGSFELVGSFFILNHCRALWKSKQAYGVSLMSMAFFFLWSLYNTYYYPQLDQVWSFVGGLFICAANCIWISLIIHVRRTATPPVITSIA